MTVNLEYLLMSAASENDLLRRVTYASHERASAFRLIEVRSTYVVIAIVTTAVLLRLYGISFYPLEGDEYRSLVEAKSVGLNWNSIIYSSMMHFWAQFGSSELWLRLPAAVFGAVTVPVMYKLGERLAGSRAAWVAAILAATSPFNIYHSQEVRFYSLFMFAAAVFMLATMTYVDSGKSRRDRSLVLITGLFLLISLPRRDCRFGPKSRDFYSLEEKTNCPLGIAIGRAFRFDLRPASHSPGSCF